MTPPTPRQSAVTLYVIYDHPIDFPDEFVCRRWVLDRLMDEGREPFARAKTLNAIRCQLPPGLFMMHRWDHDDPAILEIWI